MGSVTWRLIRSGYLSGAMNMAVDETLLESVSTGRSEPVLRLYRWQPPTLTLGYGQSIISDIDRNACSEAGIDIVRRATGGRAVLHAHEVTYAVIARLEAGHFASSVLECYRVIAVVLQQMLTDLGIDAYLVPGESRGGHGNPARAVCFSAPSQYELVVAGRKVVGSAQKRQGQAFLQHGSIPLTIDLNLLARILKVSGADSVHLEKVGWLQEWTSHSLTVDSVEETLINAFERCLDLNWSVSELTPEEQQRARILHDEKFASENWTGKR